jgi:hypothetical protein
MVTWEEILEQRGVDFEKMAQEQRHFEDGCLVRSLESIAQTHATDENGRYDLNRLIRM